MSKRCKFKIKQIKIYILIYLFLNDEKTDNLEIESVERKEEEGRKREERKVRSDHVSGS